MIDVALRAFLLGDAIIASAVGTRIYPVKLPQQTDFPSIVMMRITSTAASHLHGQSSLKSERWQIDVIVKEVSGIAAYAECQRIGDAVRERLEAYVGSMTDTGPSPDLVYATSVDWLTSRDAFESDVNGGFYTHSSDYQVWSALQ